jgi:tetratricopeptide (TPR) repeat protein
MYVPSIGIFIAVVWFVADFARRPLMLAAGYAAIIAALAFLSYRQTSYWINGVELFRHAIAVTGENPESCENLGDTLLRRRRYAEAEVELRKVLAKDPVQFTQTPGELARAIAGQGANRVGESIAFVHGSIADDEAKAKAMNELALFIAPAPLNRYADAIELLKEAIAIAPKQPALSKNLSWIYATCPDTKFRDGKKAVELARHACEQTGWSKADYRVALADAYLEAGDRARAIEELRAAQEISPTDKGIAKKLHDALTKLP